MGSNAAWQDLVRQLARDESWRSVFVIGPSDSGKTTFCRRLGRALAGRYRTAAIDCDPGQSTFGPPTTVGLAWEPWEIGPPAALRFVGATSPAGHFLQTLTGIKRLAELAVAEGAERLVFDSSGFDGSPPGCEFHFQVVDLLDPEHLVALQRGDELEPWLVKFARRMKPATHRLAVPAGVVARTRSGRRTYRERKFRRYFTSAGLRTLAVTGVGLHGMLPDPDSPATARNRLAALCSRRGFVIALGIVERWDPDAGCLEVFAPPFDVAAVATVQFGSLRLERSGREG